MWRNTKSFIGGSAVGIGSYWLYEKLRTDYTGIHVEQKNLIMKYIEQNNLKIPMSLYIAKLYQMLQQKYYHFGLMETLQGYNFHEIYFNKNASGENNNLHLIFSVNQALCGHQGINHGGISATIADTMSAYLGIYNVKNPVATSTMNIKYLKPVFANKIYAYQTEFVRRQNRDVYMKGKIVQLEKNQVALTADIKYKVVRWNTFAKLLIRVVLGQDKYTDSYSQKK